MHSAINQSSCFRRFKTTHMTTMSIKSFFTLQGSDSGRALTDTISDDDEKISVIDSASDYKLIYHSTHRRFLRVVNINGIVTLDMSELSSSTINPDWEWERFLFTATPRNAAMVHIQNQTHSKYLTMDSTGVLGLADTNESLDCVFQTNNTNDALFSPTHDRFVSLKLAQTGATGAVGPTGADGAVGPAGATGAVGADGVTDDETLALLYKSHLGYLDADQLTNLFYTYTDSIPAHTNENTKEYIIEKNSLGLPSSAVTLFERVNQTELAELEPANIQATRVDENSRYISKRYFLVMFLSSTSSYDSTTSLPTLTGTDANGPVTLSFTDGWKLDIVENNRRVLVAEIEFNMYEPNKYTQMQPNSLGTGTNSVIPVDNSVDGDGNYVLHT